jgi:hypothetical protein
MPMIDGHAQAAFEKALRRLGGGNQAEALVALEQVRQGLKHDGVGVGDDQAAGIGHVPS